MNSVIYCVHFSVFYGFHECHSVVYGSVVYLIKRNRKIQFQYWWPDQREPIESIPICVDWQILCVESSLDRTNQQMNQWTIQWFLAHQKLRTKDISHSNFLSCQWILEVHLLFLLLSIFVPSNLQPINRLLLLLKHVSQTNAAPSIEIRAEWKTSKIIPNKRIPKRQKRRLTMNAFFVNNFMFELKIVESWVYCRWSNQRFDQFQHEKRKSDSMVQLLQNISHRIHIQSIQIHIIKTTRFLN